MNRTFLKERAKTAFKRNYWICVVVALILAMITGALASSGSVSSFRNGLRKARYEDSYRYEAKVKESANVLDVASPGIGDIGNTAITATAIGLGFIIIMVVILIVAAVGIAISVFVTNIFEVGARKFFLENTSGPVKIDSLIYGFNNGHYMNVVKVQFMKHLYIFLWCLLFIIPGIIKAFEYYYVSYLLSEDPTLDYNTALKMSSEMTNGHKWDIFVLELSFIGWHILGGITFHLVDIFWTNPYQYATEAELYLYAKNGYQEVVEKKLEVKEEKTEIKKETKVEAPKKNVKKTPSKPNKKISES